MGADNDLFKTWTGGPSLAIIYTWTMVKIDDVNLYVWFCN